MDYGHITVKGSRYTLFSCLKASEGRMRKDIDVYQLKEAGIKSHRDA